VPATELHATICVLSTPTVQYNKASKSLLTVSSLDPRICANSRKCTSCSACHPQSNSDFTTPRIDTRTASPAHLTGPSSATQMLRSAWPLRSHRKGALKVGVRVVEGILMAARRGRRRARSVQRTCCCARGGARSCGAGRRRARCFGPRYRQRHRSGLWVRGGVIALLLVLLLEMRLRRWGCIRAGLARLCGFFLCIELELVAWVV
jgi:hypothetical protein